MRYATSLPTSPCTPHPTPKALLRPVSMMVPDFTLIAEISLFSEGFAGAKALARKMTGIMELSQQQLSKQDHYDYGGMGSRGWGGGDGLSCRVLISGYRRQACRCGQPMSLLMAAEASC